MAPKIGGAPPSQDITMKRITSTLLVAALPALGFSTNLLLGSATATAPQEQEGSADEVEVDENPPPPGFNAGSRVGFDIFGRKTRIRGNTFAERIKGGWRLERLVIPGSNPRGRIAQGFMHIGESFMSLELHALYEDRGGGAIPENDVHTAFTAEYHVDSSGKMFCSTIIGSFIDEETGELRWERTGFEREYRLIETLELLEVTFTDPDVGQGKMYFRPFVPRTLGSKDVFGRNEIGSYGATDIFGRSTVAEQGDRDIYGRPAPPVEDPEGESAGDDPEGESGEAEAAKRKRRLPTIPKGPGAGGAPLSGRGGK